MKKVIIGTLIVLLIIILIIAFLFTVPVMRNNILLNKYANQLYLIPLPSNTSQISRNKSVGNLYGTGNHLDFVATMEIKSTLSEKELIEYYNEMNNIKSADELSWLGLKPYNDTVTYRAIQNIEIIPKAQAQMVTGSSAVFERTNIINDNIDMDLFIIQIKDTHYGADLDIRTH